MSTIEISEIVWFDDISNSVIIAFDNITITFTMQEFFHFLSSVKEAEKVLMDESADIKNNKEPSFDYGLFFRHLWVWISSSSSCFDTHNNLISCILP